MIRRLLILLPLIVIPTRAILAQPATMPAQVRDESVTSEREIPYAADDNPRHRLDLFVPKQRKAEKLPAIVYVHGGAWMQGSKAEGSRWLMPFVRGGQYVGVSVGYRLSGEARWPAQIHDCKAAIRWVRANADKYGIDPDRIAVWGRSAGGHLVLMLGLSGDVPELDGDLGPHKGVSSKVTCVANFFGVTDIPAMPDQPSSINRTGADCPEARLIGGAIRENEPKAKAASPITYITANDPPVLSVHGDRDRIVPFEQAIRLDAALQKAGVASYFVTMKNAGHGDFGTAADGCAEQFFGKYLLGKDVVISIEAIESRPR